jgi:hypothetical protein
VSRRTRKRPRGSPWWAQLPDEELLELRLSSLGLRIAGSPLEARVAQLARELERARLRLCPSVWLSSAWFSPEGVPGFAIPFYLAHPRLVALERRLGHVEGASRAACLRLLRHEAGHALDTAYALRRRKGWRAHFGSAREPYHWSYRPRPGSRRYVQNLENWYAQSHPSEDFAETFAVWLGSRGRWRSRYRGWPALRKLEYVDGLMHEIRGLAPLVRSREHTDSLPTLALTLRQYYRRKQGRLGRTRRGEYPR